MLQPLTGLQQLQLTCSAALFEHGFGDKRGGMASVGEVPGYERDAVAALLQVVGGLGDLAEVRVKLQMQLSESAAAELRDMVQELLPKSAHWLLPYCKVATGVLSIDSGAYWPMP
jgi:hypothetical protein